jgi:hypothetical protein
MELYTLVYIYDRDVDVKVKTFTNRKDAIAYKNRLVFEFADNHSGITSITKDSSTSEYFCYIEGGYTNAQIHIIKSEI